MTDAAEIEDLSRRCQMRPDEVREALKFWASKPPIKAVLAAQVERLIEHERTKLETFTENEFWMIQAKIRALRETAAIIRT